MKKFSAAVMALIMLVTVFGGMIYASAEDAVTFYPTSSPGTTSSVTTIETGIKGMTLSIGADTWTQAAANVKSSSGVNYKGYIVGKANPKVGEGIGTYYSFAFDDTIETGSLEIMYQLGNGKEFYITDNGEPLSEYNGMTIETKADLSTTIIVQGGHTYNVYALGTKMRFYGCTFKNVNPAVEFADEISKFPFDKIKGENADIDHVENDLILIDSYESQFGSCDVSWKSTDSKIIDTDGTVNCQKTDAKITLTGHFSVQENRSLAADRVFEITVLADPDDNVAVQTAADALTLGDTTSVKNNLELPSAGKKGTSISWSTSDASIIGADGNIYPASGVDKTAVLTATISRGDASTTKEFTVTVAGIVPITAEAYVYTDKDGKLSFSPTDGGYIHSITVSRYNPNPSANDAVIAAVYSNKGQLKQCKTISMNDEKFKSVPNGKSVSIDVDLRMDSSDKFKIFAMNLGTAEPYMQQPFESDETVAEGARIFVVGDSTASPYGDDRYPRKGWAQMLENYFTDVKVVDLALSGRGSLDFKKEANYTTLRNTITKGDYLIVQFGHNDDSADKYTDPAGDRFTDGSYKKSMLEYIELAWEKGAHPIIATSISRRRASDAGLEKYVNAAKELAAELNVPCIDLYAKANGWINEVGVEKAKDMFNWVKKHDSRFIGYENFKKSEFYGKDSEDNTHINIYGADLISQWAADAMKDMKLPIAKKINDYRAVYPLPSYEDATSVN